MTATVLGAVRPLFRAVVMTAVPEAERLSPEAWSELEQIVERALVDRPSSVQRQVRAFLRLVNVIALATNGHGFARLDSAHRLRLLERLAASRLSLVRRGVWGIRTLAFMGYYARPAAAAEIGYRAAAGGWQARAAASAASGETSARR